MQQSIINTITRFLSLLGIENDLISNVTGTFVFLFGELLLLFIIISFAVALLQIYISKEKIQRVLSTKHKFLNSILGGVLGSITPFCSCSTIPLLTGLIKSGAPFSGVMSFLLTSPILNPAIIVLFLTFFGVEATFVYAGISFLFSVTVGFLLDKMGYSKYIKMESVTNDSYSSSCNYSNKPAIEPSYENFEGTFIQKNTIACKLALKDAVSLFKSVIWFLLLGASIGSFIYGLIPEDLLSKFAGANDFLAVPLAAVLGIPMYIRTETMLPIANALVAKGVGLGTVVALIIGGAGASIPEVSLLGAIFEKQLVITFLICIFFIATITGYAFNIFVVV